MQPADHVWRERGLRDAVLRGDERAWRTWYDECFDGLYGYVLWRCGGLRDHADELVQETWLVAIRRIGSFDPAQGTFPAWLRGIAAHQLRNHFRREQRRGHSSLNGVDLAAPAVSDQRERGERVARALSRLPGHYEAVLRAKYLDGQSVADIAATRNDTPKAIESLLTRARQAFREMYDERE
jgi:RNA polymerase sigma-70 factor (ECF subfamily)